MLRNRLLLLSLLSAALAFTACSGKTIDNDSPPEAQYEEGLKLMKRERYVEAVERFRALKSHYPYSKYAPMAALKIADAHFEDETYIESASAYKVFRELYPKNPDADYALYRVGESEYNLVSDTPDRDLDSANAAIAAYEQLQKDYPNCKYNADAEKKIEKLRGKLAEKEDYVGDFYFKREQYSSATGRYRYLLDHFPNAGYSEKALYRLAFSYEKTGDYTKAQESLDRLDLEFPNGTYAKEVTSLKANLAKDQAQQ